MKTVDTRFELESLDTVKRERESYTLVNKSSLLSLAKREILCKIKNINMNIAIILSKLWHRGKSRIFWKKEKNCSTASSEKILILRAW